MSEKNPFETGPQQEQFELLEKIQPLIERLDGEITRQTRTSLEFISGRGPISPTAIAQMEASWEVTFSENGACEGHQLPYEVILN